jgi:hypothetical protein
MNKNQNFRKSLFLWSAPLVASLNISILPSNAATLTGYGMERNIGETTYLLHEFVISANSGDTDISDHHQVLLKNLLDSTEDDIDYSRSILEAEINPTPPPTSDSASEDPYVETLPKNNTAKAPTKIYRESLKPLTIADRAKIAQLPKAMSIEKEVKSLFDPLQIIGGALGLGFLIWMLLQD